MSYIYVIVAQNLALSFILVPKFWSKVKNSKFRDTPFFRRADFAGPGVGPKKFFGPKNCFAVLHMSQLSKLRIRKRAVRVRAIKSKH